MKTKKNWPFRDQESPDQSDPVTRAFNYSVKYLSFRQRTVKEVFEYLTKKRFSEDVINTVLKKLIDLKFLNDEEFATSWTSSRQKYKGKSKYVIKNELRLKGVGEDLIENVLNEATDDIETAKLAYNKKKKSLERFTPDIFKKKMTAYLQRKGYSWNIISRLFREQDRD